VPGKSAFRKLAFRGPGDRNRSFRKSRFSGVAPNIGGAKIYSEVVSLFARACSVSEDPKMNRYETALLVSFLPFYFLAFGLYNLMVFKVNRHLPLDRRIPHRLFWGHWNRLKNEYNSFYPRGILYQLTLSCAVSALILAVTLFAFRFWEYASGK
jgi:hypothetical protein